MADARPAARVTAALAPAWFALTVGVWLAALGVDWRAVWAAWFWTPAPFEALPLLAALARHAVETIGACVVLLAALAAGPPLVAWAGRERRAGALLRLTAGLVVVLPASGLGLGLAGLLRAGFLRAIVAAAAGAGLHGLLAGRRCSPGQEPRGPSTGEVAAMAALCLPALLVALAPETSYDALQYHLALPARYLAHGRVFDDGLEPLSNFHLGGEMLLAIGRATGGDGVARLVSFAGLPLVLALAAAAARGAGLTGPLAVLPWLALASSPTLSEVAGHAYTDLAAVAALAAAALLIAGGKTPWFLLGLLFGAAGGIKLNASLLGGAALAVLTPRGHRLSAAAGWLLPQLPWVAKNWLLAGTPFGGLVLGSVFPALAQAEETRSFTSHMQWVPLGHPSLWLWLPRFLLRDAASAGGEYSPLLVALLPALFLGAGRDRPAAVRRLGQAVLVAIAVWIPAGGGQARWLAPVFPLALIAAATRLKAPSPRAAKAWSIAGAGVAAACWSRICAGQFVTASPLNVALGLEAPRTYLSSRLTPRGWYMAVGTFLDEHPALGRPYLAGDIKAYYWPRDPLVDSQHRIPWLVRWARDGGRLVVRLRQHRVGCLVHRMEGSLTMQRIAGGYPWSERSLATLERFVARDLDPVWTVERPAENVYCVVYAVRPRTRKSAFALHWVQLPYAEDVYDSPDKALAAGRLDEAARGYRDLITRWPGFALPRLRLAEVARLRRDSAGQRSHERAAAALLGFPAQ